MAEQEVLRSNFSGGELSENMDGRGNLEVFQNGCRRLKNFISQVQGPAQYRTGFNHVHHSRLNQEFVLLSFEFNDEQAYVLEFTDEKIRFYRNNGIILESDVTITNITKTNPGVVTAAAHGYSDGDEVFIKDVVGMTEVNGKSFIVANSTAGTFELTDVDGANVDTSDFTLYSSGGASNRIVEIDSPYKNTLSTTLTQQLFKIEKDQDADKMYITHPFYLPRELTRTSDTEWTLTLQVRTSDPLLTGGTGDVITDITQANPGVVTAVAHTFSDGDIVVIEQVDGMVEVNGVPFIVANSAVNTFELTDLNGTNVDTTGFTIYSANGFVSNQNLIPNAVAIYESRLWYAGTDADPAKLFASQAPDSSGDTQYTDFTTGTDPEDGLAFTINTAGPNKIFWLAGTDRLLMAGTHGSLIKITGSDDEVAITPTNIKARALERIGVTDVAPINKESFIMYVEKGGLTVKNLQFEALRDNFVSTDQNLVADHITQGNGLWSRLNADPEQTGVKQLTWQNGRPNTMWAIRKDGLLLGQTFKPEEGIAGWHRHTTGASGEDKFLTVAVVPRTDNFDQLWVGTERVIDGITRRYVSFQADKPVHPRAQDFFTGKNNKDIDTAKFNLSLLESMKEYVHLDEALTFDGRNTGINASATMTPGATTGTLITFTASAAVFTSTVVDVGREIWKRAINGIGTGRARIVTITSPTEAVCNILNGADFDDTDAMAPGDWYLTTDSLSNVDHLEGRSASIVTDGGAHPNRTVTNGAVTLDYQASVIHIGLFYEGFLQPMSLEFGGETGPSNSKIKNIREFGFRFLNTLGAEYGTDIYKPEVARFATMPLAIGQPGFLFSGIKRQGISDDWEKEKIAYVRQTNSLPCIVQELILYGDAEES